MQLKSRQAIVRLRAMKTKVIGFEDTIEGAVSAIIELESQIDEKDKNLVTMNNTFLDLIDKFHDIEEENAKLRAELEAK
jgi:hypothetical protein